MSNDSSTGGYLTPESALPLDDLAFDAFLQPIIVGISGLPDGQVIVKGQAVPPSQPDRPLTWCAYAITNTDSDINPSYAHDGSDDAGLGTSTEIRAEYIDVTASFYGPAAMATATLLRDGLNIGQNRETMRASGVAYVGMDPMTFVPDLQNTQYIRRVDLVFNIRRMSIRTYPIRNVLSAEGTVAVSGNIAGELVVNATFNTENAS